MKSVFLGIIGLMMGITATAWSGEIVAVVNDEPISSYDVEARAKLIAVQRASYLSNQKKAQYVQEALDSIIDDKVKVAEAEKNHFSVSEKEIDAAVRHLEEQNGMKPGSMGSMLEKNGVPLRILRDQIRADLMWVQVLQKQGGVISEITPAEIEKKKNELRAKLREEEFFVFEILVPKKEDAEKCYVELQKGLAFDEAAKKYSKAKTARNGGEVGWVKNNHYSKAVTDVLRQLNPGDLSAPLKTQNGYLLLLLQDKKTPILSDTVTVWSLAQMAMPTTQAVQFEKELSQIKTCEDFMAFGKKYAIAESVKSGAVSPEQLPIELKDILAKESLKTVIGPVRTQDIDIFFMKCNVEDKKILPDDAILKAQIENEKMEVLSDKVLKSVKRYAVIEYK